MELRKVKLQKQTLIGRARTHNPQPWLRHVDDAPVVGASPVYWLINDEWVLKGWLMPPACRIE